MTPVRTTPASSAESVLGALAAGLRRRADEQRRAEERLANFAFHEERARPGGPGASEAGLHPSGPGAGPVPPAGPTWRYHVARALHTAGDLDAVALLAALRRGPLTLDELAAGPRRVGDRAATADWIGGLSAAGFVTRELEAGLVTLAPLGSAILDLIEDLEGRLAAAGDAP